MTSEELAVKRQQEIDQEMSKSHEASVAQQNARMQTLSGESAKTTSPIGDANLAIQQEMAKLQQL